MMNDELRTSCSSFIIPHSAFIIRFVPFAVSQTFIITQLSMQPDRPTPTITLYVIPDCPLCADARARLQRSGVEFRERDVASDFGALRTMYRLTRQNLVPVVEVGGRALVRPTDDELRQLLH
jgi:glutaredoxin